MLDEAGSDVAKNVDLLKRINDGGFDLGKVGDLYKNQKAPAGFKGKVDFEVTKNIDGVDVTIKYDKDGFPDFTKVSPGKEFIFKADDLAGNSTDFTRANTWAKNNLQGDIKIKGTRIEIDGVPHTWHHHQDGKSLFPVPSNIHNTTNQGFNHSGGAAVIERGLQGLFESPIF